MSLISGLTVVAGGGASSSRTDVHDEAVHRGMQYGPCLSGRKFQVERAPLTERSSESCDVKQDGFDELDNGPAARKGAVSNFAPNLSLSSNEHPGRNLRQWYGGSQPQIRVSRL
jgi:hypothetical protein